MVLAVALDETSPPKAQSFPLAVALPGRSLGVGMADLAVQVSALTL
jgi:hypothetical protein